MYEICGTTKQWNSMSFSVPSNLALQTTDSTKSNIYQNDGTRDFVTDIMLEWD